MKRYKKIIIRGLIITLALCIAYVAWVPQLKYIKIANLKVLDILFSINQRFHRVSEAIDKVVIISIDDESLREMKLRWPWPRGVIAGIIKKLSGHSPSFICMDIVFAGKSSQRDQDLILAKAMQDAKNVFTAAYFGKDGKYVVPDELIARSAKSFGFVNKPPDADNAVRRLRSIVFSIYGNIIDYSLAAKVAAAFLNQPVETIVSRMPLLKDNTAYIYFFSNKAGFKVIPVWKVFKDEISLNQLKGKMVFLGITAKVFHDTFQTPLGTMDGVILVVNETLTFVTNKFFHYPGYGINFFILFVFVFIALLAGFRLSTISGIMVSLTEIVSFFLLTLILFTHHIIIDVFGAIFLVGLVSIFLYGNRYITLVVENIILRKEATTDGLTQLYVYRYFQLRLKMELKKAVRENRLLALTIYDIDHFKKINDTYGHGFGNEVLKTVAKILKDNSRKRDTVARYGGEEFCILVPDTKVHNVRTYAERIQNKVRETRFTAPNGKIVNVTISAGIVTTDTCPSKKYKDFINAADSALYQSKTSGRDRISLWAP